jgi:hypothetical protein
MDDGGLGNESDRELQVFTRREPFFRAASVGQNPEVVAGDPSAESSSGPAVSGSWPFPRRRFVPTREEVSSILRDLGVFEPDIAMTVVAERFVVGLPTAA